MWGRLCLRKWEWWCGSEEENGVMKMKMKKKRIVVSMEVRILVANEGIC